MLVHKLGSVEVTVKAKYEDSTINISAVVLSNITSLCPAVKTSAKPSMTLSVKNFAYRICGTPGRIDILL